MSKVQQKIKELKEERKVYIEDFVKMSKYVTSLSFENDKDLTNQLRSLSEDIYMLDEKISFLENLI